MNTNVTADLRYESRERTPSIHVITVKADVLGTFVAYLAGESNDLRPDCYLIHVNTEPQLFQLVETYRSMDAKRKLDYLHIF